MKKERIALYSVDIIRCSDGSKQVYISGDDLQELSENLQYVQEAIKEGRSNEFYRMGNYINELKKQEAIKKRR